MDIMKIDMTGNPCPMPVVAARKALESEEVETVEVTVDNFVAVENLRKMANSLNCSYSYSEEGKDKYVVLVSRKGQTLVSSVSASASEKTDITHDEKADELTVLITTNAMGQGSEELGKILIKGFIFSLTELNPIPSNILFLNSGVKLTTDGANTIADLKCLEEKGAKIYSCGTCLNYYNLTEKLEVGEITDMMGIVSTLAQGSKIISI